MTVLQPVVVPQSISAGCETQMGGDIVYESESKKYLCTYPLAV